MDKKNAGFTLIEILVVVAIIGMLAAVVMVSLKSARAKGRDAKRKVDLSQLQKAVELYYNTNNSYPATGTPTGSSPCYTDPQNNSYYWYGLSANGGSKTTTGPTQYIPGLSPNFVSTLPKDPGSDTSGWSGFLYCSDGISYKILSHMNGPESFPLANEPFYDPVRPTWAWKVCNGQTACDAW